MPNKYKSQEIKIIYQYEKNIDGKEEKSLQKLLEKLFSSYIEKVIQNIYKGK